MAAEFSDEEISAVKNRYPRLERIAPDAIGGILDMSATFNSQTLSDVFEIKITTTNPHSDRLPALYEVGGRTQIVAAKYSIGDLRDLHRNLDGTVCVCVKQEEDTKYPPGSDLSTFVENLVVPYFYGLLWYEQNREWPWGEYSHGIPGLLEYFVDDAKEQTEESVRAIALSIQRDPYWKRYVKQLRKPNPNKGCPCGKGKSFSTCHEKAYRGLLQLQQNMKRLRLNPYKIFRPT